MKTIIVGYTDRDGLSTPEILCGPEVSPADQAEGMSQAKRLHKFPEGILRVEMYALGEAIDTAIFISDEAAMAVQNVDKRNRQLQREQRERDQAAAKVQANLITANKVFTLFAQKRNNAIAAVAAQKNMLSAALPDKDRAKIVAKITELQPAVDLAIAEFKTVLAARDVIKNKESAPEDIASAMEILKDPVKWNQKFTADRLAAEKAAAEAAAAAAARKLAEDKAAADKAEAERLAAEKALAEAGGQVPEAGNLNIPTL